MENLDKRDTDFRKDLVKYGKTGEKDIAKFFETRGYTIDKTNDDSKYDLLVSKIGKRPLSIEVKADYKCITPSIKGLPSNDTGNIFIEYTSWNRDAGINTTEADIYAYMYGALNPRELWLIPVENLHELIGDNNFPTTKDSGDEGSNTEGYLIPRWDFFYDFAVYKEIEGKWKLQITPN